MGNVPWMVAGQPMWGPQQSIQNMDLWDQMEKSPKGPERDALADEWCADSIRLMEYQFRKMLGQLPTRVWPWSSKRAREVATYNRLFHTYQYEIQDWWRARFREKAKMAKERD